jgi:hypothetical protein
VALIVIEGAGLPDRACWPVLGLRESSRGHLSGYGAEGPVRGEAVEVGVSISKLPRMGPGFRDHDRSRPVPGQLSVPGRLSGRSTLNVKE